jgi:FkbM family methyltransferase
MRRALRKIRKIEIVNLIVRTVLKTIPPTTFKVFDNFQKRWPVYGLVDCEFKDVKFKMYNQGDDGLVHYFFYGLKYYEESDLFLFKELSKASKCVLDIGANTGLYSIISSISNSELDIYAFEPYPINTERLRTNLKANGIENKVKVVSEALGENVGDIKISIPENMSITSVASVSNEFSRNIHPDLKWKTITVPVNTLDNFKRNIKKSIDLIKCDVETFEMSVFKGAFDTLEKDRPTIIFESFLDSERIEFFNNILRKFNYYLYLILENGIVYSENGFSENHGLNFLITPVKPVRTFLGYNHIDLIKTAILLRPTKVVTNGG